MNESRADALQHGPRPLPLFLSMLHHETADDPGRRHRALSGLTAYQNAARPAPAAPLPVVARAGRAVLRDGGGTGRPVVLVPSLINPPDILDLPDRSLLRWLARRGVHALLVDWGSPDSSDGALDLTGHVERSLLPLLARLDAPPVLVGYCLGGTIAWGAAAAMPVAGIATIAAPWRFSGYGDQARAAMAAQWRDVRPAATALGLLPMEALQAGFWRLDPARTIAKYERFATLDPDGAAARAFVQLEDWANAGAPLTLGAGAELFDRFVGGDAPGSGGWRVTGRIVDPHWLAVPAVEFVSATDRIVPAATAAGLADRRSLALGHVGMMIGGRAEAALWRPLAHWIASLPPSTPFPTAKDQHP